MVEWTTTHMRFCFIGISSPKFSVIDLRLRESLRGLSHLLLCENYTGILFTVEVGVIRGEWI
ncbi:hypothetical protein KFK09_001733 [Dendrobium nobile]|uniref:Uncharacterized protein n=1 Tax=Dendrobium nobile TaxID=94219 RepID=A0A8T3C5M2_DENNO|nr:hypothetical protein KFK09_001733 [Dendrobium nobile]